MSESRLARARSRAHCQRGEAISRILPVVKSTVMMRHRNPCLSVLSTPQATFRPSLDHAGGYEPVNLFGYASQETTCLPDPSRRCTHNSLRPFSSLEATNATWLPSFERLTGPP